MESREAALAAAAAAADGDRVDVSPPKVKCVAYIILPLHTFELDFKF
jgi:hypothetical protein